MECTGIYVLLGILITMFFTLSICLARYVHSRERIIREFIQKPVVKKSVSKPKEQSQQPLLPVTNPPAPNYPQPNPNYSQGNLNYPPPDPYNNAAYFNQMGRAPNYPPQMPMPRQDQHRQQYEYQRQIVPYTEGNDMDDFPQRPQTPKYTRSKEEDDRLMRASTSLKKKKIKKKEEPVYNIPANFV